MLSIRSLKPLMSLSELFQIANSSKPSIKSIDSKNLIKNRYTKTVSAAKKKKQFHDRILKQASRQQAIYQKMSWRDYQKSLNQTRKNRKHLKRVLIGAVLSSVAAGMIYALLPLAHRLLPIDAPKAVRSSISEVKIGPEQAALKLNKSDIKELLSSQELLNLTSESVELTHNGQHYKIETSLDPSLQTTLINSFDKVNSRYIGIVAMDPDTGRLIAYTGFNKTSETLNPCTTNKFPAASIFKIITAAAAAEKLGYSGSTQMKFNGYKHTLYKKQLKDRENRYTNHVSFRKSFAQSINPVFGKLGSLRLGKDALEEYGEAFGFNHQFNTDFDISPSRLSVTEDTYHHAEIASGFNRDTTLSPVHGAMIVSTALNGGGLIEPSIVDRILDDSGAPLYSDPAPIAKHIISSRTSNIIHGMMESTVKSGTARKAFRGYTRDKVLKKLIIGGKTGSIYNKPHDARFDWFVGFAKTKDRSEQLVIAVVVAHEEYIGRRAGEYARLAFKTYFKNYFAQKEAKRKREEKS